jgi:MFS family permease
MPYAQPIKGGWVIVTPRFFRMLTNFIDKAIIGLARVRIMRELQLTPKQFGLVNSSFCFLVSLSAIVTGFIVNRIQARWALLATAEIRALTRFPMIGTVGFGTLIGCRVALGTGARPACPVAQHAAYRWFPNELRTSPAAIMP